VLGALPRDLDAAVFVVQHLPPAFSPAFVDFLGSRTDLVVKLVSERTPIQRGVVYVAEGDRHLAAVQRKFVEPVNAPPRSGHSPSVDVLMESLAAHFGQRAVGALLSGMGQDGVLGLGELKRVGGLCLAQSRETCAVWGMPKVASEAGIAEQILPPLELAQAIVRFCR
jgi:two-component system chemotaxis response regulator CheB